MTEVQRVSLLCRLTSSQRGERYKFICIRIRDQSEWIEKEEIQPPHLASQPGGAHWSQEGSTGVRRAPLESGGVHWSQEGSTGVRRGPLESGGVHWSQEGSTGARRGPMEPGRVHRSQARARLPLISHRRHQFFTQRFIDVGKQTNTVLHVLYIWWFPPAALGGSEAPPPAWTSAKPILCLLFLCSVICRRRGGQERTVIR
ncbi:hypothetical protein EYF80_051986 [Liparis tanakae]|uniref:Uncharacterized protein n=1 Tax=Liparis tanakae TaxID=230148 RepID=A0A4Z2FAD1_9TELE|nr:hypothetical protein EYF80_051986 [Liparis tanakae]